MRYVKIALLLGTILIGSTIVVQANNGVVHTYEQTAEKMYVAYLDAMTEKVSDFHEPVNLKTQAFNQIEAEIAEDFGTNREQVQRMIADYKQNYITAIQSETEHLKENIDGMYGDYANEKQKTIQEEITEDIATFLENELSE